MKSLIKKTNCGIKSVMLCLSVIISINIYAQNTSTITGKILEEKNNQPIAFASIRLTGNSDSTSGLITGTISNDSGVYTIDRIPWGKYKLQVTFMGYKTATRLFEISSPGTLNLDTIYLQDSSIFITETAIVADRIRGKSKTDKTIYYVNKKMLSATGNAPDLLRHIPGVQVDLKQNVSINGLSNILICIDGKERDRSYISRLSPSQIDRIEVMSTPPSNYDGNISGVLNIVLKKEKVSGLSGHLFSEIPVSGDLVYMFPTYNLNYNYKKINLYTSYNGEINYEDIDEKLFRKIIDDDLVTDISSVQDVRQKNLSHKFHYGVDYQMSSKDILNFYGFVNHSSYEQDGSVFLHSTAANDWEVQKDETDHNRSLFNSLYYKHLFNAEGREITFDISTALIRSENEIIYQNDLINQVNAQDHRQAASVVKVDYTTPFNERLKGGAGIKFKNRDIHDNTSEGFYYKDQVYAMYGTLNYQVTNFDFNIGLRAENAKKKLNEKHDKSALAVLPYFAMHYNISGHHNLYLSYRRSVKRPSVYQLNPYSYIDDPYAIRKGNPLLGSEFRRHIQLKYTTRFRSNFMSTGIFYETRSDVINPLIYLNDNNILITQMRNLGDIHQYGLQMSAALKYGMFSLNPSFRLYKLSTLGNKTAKQFGIENKDNPVFETGISSILSFKKDFALSVMFKYATAKENIQGNAYCDALYLMSLDKSFKNNLKIGLTAALPFAKSFVYQGSDIHAANFVREYTGILKLPTVPFMFRLSYRFKTGKIRSILEREKESVDTRPREGFF